MRVLEHIYNTAMEYPLQILEIFNEFFGESRVDMQGFPTLAEVESSLSENSSINDVRKFINTRIAGNKGFILVHFPHVRITNEHDRYVEANHLYAKVWFDIEGRIQGRFALNRSEYTVLHFVNNYMHSHVSNIPTYNFEDFQNPCTGTGPINNTICSLARDFDADLWRLFCLELDRYMQVESIAGTPYHRLESLINGGYRDSYIVFQNIRFCEKLSRFRFQNFLSVSQLAEFVKYVIDSNILKVTYQNNGYYLAMSPTEYYIKLSNLFIKWYNKKWKKREVTETLQDLLSHQILGKYKVVNNKILKSSNDRYNNYQSYIGAKICTFKGQDIRLVISDAVAAEDNNSVLILNQEICEYIFTKIFNVINFRYGNSKQQTGDSSHKKIYFL